ncbi:MAG: bifunctional DNA-formamidopyrimidine glycosylase/DNA-(apurinic or apyrimidinic site) lyase [Robiginitomaculum sp.]
MPELPEVETVKRGLAPVMEGRVFENVVLNRADIRFPFPSNFKSRLVGTTLITLSRRAKFLKADLSSGETLLMHLGMSGSFIIGAARGRENPKHDHVIFTMRGEKTPIIYNDPRRFGFMELLGQDKLGRLANLGPEPLSNNFHGPALYGALRGKKSPIKTALLDQRVVAGLGNIYVCEALYSAKISPLRKSCHVNEAQCERLCTEIQKILERAIKAGGSTLKDFSAVDGSLGYFQHRFKVYGQEANTCHNKDCTGKIARIKQSGRSTFHCPKCQI